MHTLIRSATLAFLFLLLASCGGGAQRDQTSGDTLVVVPAPVTSDAVIPVYENLIQQLYIAYFGRPADPAGLASKAQAFSAANAPTTIGGLNDAYAINSSVRTLVNDFANNVESYQLYYTGSNLGRGVVSTAYDNLFSREPDSAGADYWAGQLKDGHVSPTTAILAILAGVQGSDAALIARKVQVAMQFTHALEAAGQRAVYDGPVAHLIVQAMIHSVPSMPDDSAVLASIDNVRGHLAALSSGTFAEAAAGVHKIVLLASTDQLASNSARLSALADALTSDLNNLRPGGPAWTVTIISAAGTVAAIREQLRPFDSAILIGRVAVATSNGSPRLDVYRLPACPLLKVDDTGEVSSFSFAGIDPRCKNGLVISILRGQSQDTETADVARKLDQMIAYHKSSSATNSSWARSLRVIEAAWFGGPDGQQAGQLDAWAGMTMFPPDAINYLDSGTAVQRRDAFVDCVTHNNEICGGNLLGAPQIIQFEGPGTPGVSNSSDWIDWSPLTLDSLSVKAKYIVLDACCTQNFLSDQSVGIVLLMNGNALLTRGAVDMEVISNHLEEAVIRNEYALLQNGSTFMDALYGVMETTPENVQGDPFITMRPVPLGPQPKLVIDGTHYNRGVLALPIILPDSVGGSKLTQVVTYSNRGDADLHLRIGVVPTRAGVDAGSSQGFEQIDTDGSVFFVEFVQTFSDGRVLTWPAFELETYGGAMHATLKPGQSVAVTYRLNVPVGADGAPKRLGQYVAEVVNTSDDPASGRVIMTLMARVH